MCTVETTKAGYISVSPLWLSAIVLLILGIVVGNIMLLRNSKDFKIPKGFKRRPYSDYDGDDSHENSEKNSSQDDK